MAELPAALKSLAPPVKISPHPESRVVKSRQSQFHVTFKTSERQCRPWTATIQKHFLEPTTDRQNRKGHHPSIQAPSLTAWAMELATLSPV